MKPIIHYAIKLVLLLYILILSSAGELQSQPYWYSSVRVDSDAHDREIARFNLATKSWESVLDTLSWIKQVKLSDDQSLLFISYVTDGILEVMNVNDLSSRKEILTHVGEIHQIIDNPAQNIIGIWYDKDDFEYHRLITFFDRTNFAQVYSITHHFRGWNREKLFFDSTGTILYGLDQDTILDKGILRSIDVASNAMMSTKLLDSIGPLASRKTFDDARNGGKAILHFSFSSISRYARYCLIDVINNQVGPPIEFPWRGYGNLSVNSDNIIVERVDYPGPVLNESYHRGEFYIFDSRSGKLKQRVILPPDGRLLLADNYPSTMYYFSLESQTSHQINLNNITPVIELLDSLRAMEQLSHSNNWLGDQSFVNELDTNLTNAQNYLVSGDSNNCYRQLQIFQQKVNEEYSDSLDGDSKWINIDGWKLLYFNAGYILDRLSVPPPQYNLNINIIGEGTVTKSPELALYDSAATVQLTANPGTDYSFSGWSGDVTSLENPIEVFMDSDKNITVTFQRNP
jgi:hypothetical protein